MGTARRVVEGLPGIAPTTLYRIDPPLEGADHLLVYHRPRVAGQRGQMTVILATEGGVAVRGRMDPAPGTYITDTPDHVEALRQAGKAATGDPAGYEIVEEAP